MTWMRVELYSEGVSSLGMIQRGSASIVEHRFSESAFRRGSASRRCAGPRMFATTTFISTAEMLMLGGCDDRVQPSA